MYSPEEPEEVTLRNEELMTVTHGSTVKETSVAAAKNLRAYGADLKARIGLNAVEKRR